MAASEAKANGTDEPAGEDFAAHPAALAEAARHLAGVLPGEAPEAFARALRKLLDCTQADRAFLYRLTSDGRHFAPLAYSAIDEASSKPLPDLLPLEEVPWGEESLLRDDIARVFRPEESPGGAESGRGLFVDDGLEAVLVSPLFAGGRLEGFLALGSGCALDWGNSDETALRVVGALIAGAWERERLSGELHAGLDLYRDAFREAPCGMALVSPQGRFLRVNRAFCDIMGRQPHELLGLGVADVTHPDDREKSRHAIRKAVESGLPFSLEKRFLRPDGEVRRAVVRAAFHPGSGMLVAHLADVSAEVESRREARSVTAHLVETARRAGMVEMARQALHNIGNSMNSVVVTGDVIRRRLENSRAGDLGRIGERLRQNRANLAAYLSEDPSGRSLVEALVALASVLDAEKGLLLQDLDRMNQHARRVAGILDDQHSFAEQAGGMVRTAISSLLDEALAFRRETLAAVGAAATRQVIEDSEIEVHSVRLLQVLDHAICAAAQALTKTDGERFLRAEAETAGHGILRISVICNGHFPPRAYKGGEGLAVSERLLAEMGGALHIESVKPGTGTIIRIEVPVLRIGPRTEDAL